MDNRWKLAVGTVVVHPLSGQEGKITGQVWDGRAAYYTLDWEQDRRISTLIYEMNNLRWYSTAEIEDFFRVDGKAA